VFASPRLGLVATGEDIHLLAVQAYLDLGLDLPAMLDGYVTEQALWDLAEWTGAL
jgi:hypothetical protein